MTDGEWRHSGPQAGYRRRTTGAMPAGGVEYALPGSMPNLTVSPAGRYELAPKTAKEAKANATRAMVRTPASALANTSLPAGIACHAHHRSLLQQRLAASTPCIGSLVDSQHRLAASSRSSNRRIGSLCIGSLHRNHGTRSSWRSIGVQSGSIGRNCRQSALCFRWSRSSLLFERAPCHGGSRMESFIGNELGWSCSFPCFVAIAWELGSGCALYV